MIPKLPFLRRQLVADGSDNFATRYAVSDACYFEKRPLVTAAVGAFDGTLTVLRPYEDGPFGEPNPTYRCLYPEPPPDGTVPACSEAGVLGALTSILGAMMALEVIREIVGFGSGLVGRLVLVDALGMPTSFFSGLFAGSRWGIVEQRTLTPLILLRIQVPQPRQL